MLNNSNCYLTCHSFKKYASRTSKIGNLRSNLCKILWTVAVSLSHLFGGQRLGCQDLLSWKILYSPTLIHSWTHYIKSLDHQMMIPICKLETQVYDTCPTASSSCFHILHDPFIEYMWMIIGSLNYIPFVSCPYKLIFFFFCHFP